MPKVNGVETHLTVITIHLRTLDATARRGWARVVLSDDAIKERAKLHRT